ncbi:MAG: MATE family efflux transporter [Oscillospiraceae bacterium]|nr:MATE family efflux transporter [Oscillospiraceae bacterium]
MSRVTDMTKGSPAKLMLGFAVPVVLTNLGQQLYQIVDAAIVGRGVGVDALAAVGCTDWTYWMILWSVSVMASGFATFVSRYFGSREYEKMNRAIVTMTVLSAVIALVLTGVGLALTRPILIFLGTPAEILPDAVTYLSTMIAGTLVVTLYNLTASILRAFGDSRSPLVAMILAAVLNILLDILFVLTFRWGVFGAALASVLSQLFSLVYCTVKIGKIEYVKPDRVACRWDGRLAWEIFRFGVPLALQYIIINCSGMVLQSTINTQGADFIAGYTAVNKLYGLLECSAIALGSAFTTFVSQNYGAGDYLRVKKGINVSAVLAVGAAVLLIAIMLPLNRLLPRLFIDLSEQGAEAALAVAAKYLVHMILCLPVLYLVYVHRSALQGTGDSNWSLLSGILEALTRIAAAKVLFGMWGETALYWSEPLSWLSAWVFVFVPYLFYQRRNLR